MENSIKRFVSDHYRSILILSIISFFVVLSGTIYVLNYLTTNSENNDTNHHHTSGTDTFDGYNIFVLERKRQDNQLRSLELLITDMKGEVIVSKNYTKEPRGLDVYPVELFNTTTVLLGDDDGAVLWNFITNTTLDLGFNGHHDLEYNVNNNTFFTMSWYSTEMPDGYKYGFDRIHEYDWKGNQRWSLNTRDFVNTSWWCPYQDRYGERRDLTHGNTVFYDCDEDVIYYLSRNCNTFFKIDHKTKEVLWALGEYGDFDLYDLQGNPQDHLFFHAHSVEKIDSNTFILFDNDMHNQTKRDNHRSRIVEITIDETSMTAHESWSWAAPEEYYSDIWGDADRLPNGNRLGTFGTQTHPNTDIGPRLVEVNETGDILWELNFPTTEKYKYGIYRMERFRFTPTINSTDWTTTGSNVTVNWQTWYNFRTKHPTQGSYKIYLDGLLVENDSHIFNKWWLPSTLSVTLSQLPPGIHNVTAIIADEGGNIAKSTVTIHALVALHLFRDGPMIIELAASRLEFFEVPIISLL
ncbi:MAG: aryl-sulfate sulfotransferase [Candidatus Heimdallarchaeota archaeon]|nr:MAG: aryl-sulfate sulfotransferase [Candidatus Heimdallarchaeota archaeon]